uniref:Uncharacterized protein n=1 Tax=Entamoeba invadens TaxID=33085 RepID=S0B6X1_ENTIV|nr:hypothetical protein [Entamoeba invadens]
MVLAVLIVAFALTAQSYDLMVYLIPHVLPSWDNNRSILWSNWDLMVRTIDLVMAGQTVHYAVPEFYMDMEFDETKTFGERMNSNNLVFLSTSSDISVLETTIVKYLSNEEGRGGRGLGLLFQKTASGECLGNASNDTITSLNKLNEKFQNYKNYIGMDVMDSSVFETYDARNDNWALFPPLRAIHFNYFNSLSDQKVDSAIQLAKKFNTSVSIDISDMSTEFFATCTVFLEIVQKIQNQGLQFKLLINRSMWLQESGSFYGFISSAKQCLDRILF